jgi:hypothetical protein
MKRIIAVLMLIMLVLGNCLVGCGAPSGAEDTTPVVTPEASASPKMLLRIEGNNENLYYGEVEFAEGANLRDALVAFDEKENKITFTGAAEDYITAVNGETAGKFGGWDGWCVIVNGVAPATANSEVLLNDGDNVVLYYGDPWGVGMAYPTASVKDGKLVFEDSTTGAIAGAKVILGDKEYITDENGAIEGIAAGEYTVQIEKFAENGLSLVLRLAPDAKISVK